MSAAKTSEDAAAQAAVEGRAGPDGADGKTPQKANRPPAAGPHARPALTNPDATPGTGTLPPAGKRDDADSTSG